MKQVFITGKGGPEKLALRETATPEPRQGQLRIRVQAAGVNFADIMMRRGLYPDAPKLPAVPGYEVAGVVDAVGEGCDPSWLDQPVVAMCNFGGYGTSICLDRHLVFRCPGNIEPMAAAALLVNYLTAWQMIRVMAPAARGDRVLIHSAAGGVGQAVVQLCTLAGAQVLGSASPAKHDGLRRQGVQFVFDSRNRNFADSVLEATNGQGVDIVLEPRNGPWIMESYKSLAKCGRMVLFGFSHAAAGKGNATLAALRTLAGVPWFQLNPIRLMNDNKSIAGVNLGRMWDMGHKTRYWVEDLLELQASGKIEPVIDSVFQFSEAGRAHERLEQRQNVGKVILVPDGKESQ